MSAKQLPIAMFKSGPEAKSSGAVSPIPQMRSIHRDSMFLCSVSEPNLTLPSEIQVCDAEARTKVSHTDERLHTSGPVPRLLPPNGRTRLIRFQSHVRITSGISRPRRKPTIASHVAEIDMSPRSSPSSSRASSVYAPLRSRSNDENRSSGLGMAQRIRGRCLCEDTAKKGPDHKTNERTPLLNCTIQSVFEREGSDYISGDSHLSHAIDFIFGTWPGRLLNRHWWWWKIEPVLCCHCLDESDLEY
ncbi:hypothetical protein AX14_000004 [Amanita brunnescens Koide BX004]|nr:hypothetical protein AX14_000004 [Amanita brunnescens Koide BX004]